MNTYLLLVSVMFLAVCAILLISWAVSNFYTAHLGLIIPFIVCGIISLILSIFSFHDISKEQGKEEVRKELIYNIKE